MKLGTLRRRAVLIDGDRALDVGPSLRTVLGQLYTVSKLTVDDDSPRFSPDELDPPVPDPRQVFAIGLNYAPHAEEAGYALPSEPMVFTKFPSSIGPPVSSVTLPPGGHTDWEIEIVAVVGRGGRNIPEAAAWEALAGVTLGQD